MKFFTRNKKGEDSQMTILSLFYKPIGLNYFFKAASASVWGSISSANM